MPSTTNFGWTTPADTDLVKDGASAIRTLGNGIDTSFVDLKGGTTGQVLSKNSNTDLDFAWIAQDDSNAIQNAIVDAKGDLISATAADTPARLAVGTNGQFLTADSTASTGLAWTTLNAGGMTQLATASFGGAAISFQNISQDYKSLVIFVNNAVSHFRLNNETGTNYINLIADTRTQAVGSAVITQYYQPDLSVILGTYYTGSNDNVGAHQYIEIPNYASTSCRKIARSAAMGNNGTYWWFNQIWGGRTNSNDAVSRIDLTSTPTNGSATLFGVK